MFALLFAAAVAAEPAPHPRPVTPAPDRLWQAVNDLDEQLLAAEVAILRAEVAAARTAATADEAFAALDRVRRRVQESVRELNPGRQPTAYVPVHYPDPLNTPVVPEPLRELCRDLMAADLDVVRAEVGRLAGARGSQDVFDRITRLRTRLRTLNDEVYQVQPALRSATPAPPAPAPLPR